MTRRLRLAATLLALGAMGSAVACGPTGQQPAVRLWTDDFAVAISFDPSPPRALEQIEFKVVVRDRKTGQPIEGGQGRVFATNEDKKSVDNGLTPGKELGTYYAKLFFVNAGTWAVGFQFRADSTRPLQRANDWMQEILPESEPGKGSN